MMPDTELGYHFQCFDHQVIAASSSRDFRASHYPSFVRQLNIPETSLHQVVQVHGSEIIYVDGGAGLAEGTEADGLITDQRRVALGIRTADCLPVFFWDSVQKVAGVAHAGWKGVKSGIVPKMIRLFQQDFGSPRTTIQVAIGPSIKSCCYEVGDEFETFFPRHFKRPNAGAKGFVDLTGEITDQLLGEGISRSQIFDSGICTVCQNHRFFSARKEKTLDRILSVIYIK